MDREKRALPSKVASTLGGSMVALAIHGIWQRRLPIGKMTMKSDRSEHIHKRPKLLILGTLLDKNIEVRLLSMSWGRAAWNTWEVM